MLGQFQAAREAFEQSLACADTEASRAVARRNLAVNAINQGHYGRAEQYLVAMRDFIDRHADVNRQVHYRYLQGRLCFEQGQYGCAEHAIRQALEQAEQHQLSRRIPVLKLYQARLAAAQGQYDKAERMILQLLADPAHSHVYAEAYLLLADIVAVDQRPGEACGLLLKSLEIAMARENQAEIFKVLVVVLAIFKAAPFALELAAYCRLPEHRAGMYYTSQARLAAIVVDSPGQQSWHRLTLLRVCQLVKENLKALSHAW
jgi:tetratricopeptide (TPR) repeat protein